MSEETLEVMSAETAMSHLEDQLTEGWQLNGDDPKENIWAAILPMVLETLMDIVNECFTVRQYDRNASEDIYRQCQDPGRVGRFRLRRALSRSLREEYGWGAWREYDGPRIFQACIHAGECCQVNQLRGLREVAEM